MLRSRNRQLSFPFRNTAVLSALLALVAGCGGDGDGSNERRITLQFQGQVNGQDFVCGQTYSDVGVGQPGTYQVNDWRFYIHDIALVTADGDKQSLTLDQDGVWQYKNVALLDLRKNCGSGTLPTNAAIAGTISDGNYTGICFKVGIPYELNHLNDATAPSPLNNSGMLWSWRSGRKFIRIDGIGDPSNLKQSFVIHLGSTECPGSDPNAPPTAACGYPNIAEFCLSNFDADQDDIVMDVGKVLAESNVVVNTADTAPGCMSGNSDPECIPIMPRLNLDFTYVAGASSTPEQYPKVSPQVLFSVLK